ncbi:glycosyltransferase family 2 protein [Phycicoccus sp.]|uniref:glycosyltransferase family 2 protein n=1 Tax=Phycicoccus sp. TaxID=1902410 RepID=UPI002B7D6DFF|nr:glycosyltransferase family 2 protein [Phycicoccus sp.]HMM93443.1 glycosyltransferase family 2 protein [Phycicoccus sp.]
MTRVAVGLPVYNGEPYLEEALTSILAQTHADLEVVISDNASTDRTQEICERFAAQDPRVRYVRQPVNQGAAFNHNYVATAATAPYFRWYAYDDRLDPRCVEACAAVLDAEPDVVLAWPLTTVIDADGAEVSEYRDDLPFDNRSPVTRLRSLLDGPTEDTLLHMCYPVYGVVRREVFLATHLLGSNPAADTTLLVELALRGRWRQVPERLFYNRRHAASSAVDKSPEQIASWFDPSARATFPMPQSRLLVGYLRAVLTTPLSPGDRLRCLGVVAGWLTSHRRARIIAGELRIRGRQARQRLLSARGRRSALPG